MITGLCKIEIILFETNSLKEKRMIIKSIVKRIQSKFNVSIAEVGMNELWGRAELGMACVSTETKHANQMLDYIVNFIENDGRVEIIKINTEYVSLFDGN